MNPYLMITAAGPDRPGIVSRISRVLFETGCNIEDTSMTRLRGEFAMMLIVRLGPKTSASQLERHLRPVQKNLRLSLMTKALSAREVLRGGKPSGRPFILSVYGSDHPGIVYRVTRLLASKGVTVTDMNTRVIGPAQKPLYVMILEVEIPPKTSVPALRTQLGKLRKKLAVDISLQRADPARL